jgi:hypothetical protein
MSLVGDLGKEFLTKTGKGLFDTLKKKAPHLSEDDILKQVKDLGAEFFNVVEAPKAPVAEIKKPVTEVLGKNKKEPITIFRGLSDSKVQEPLGQHWSTDPSVASSFSNWTTDSGLDKKSALIKALVEPKDIAKGKEAKDLLRQRNFREHENEVPIKPGTKVRVVEIVTTKKRESGPLKDVPPNHPLFEDVMPEGGKVRINPEIKTRKRTRKFPYEKFMSIDETSNPVADVVSPVVKEDPNNLVFKFEPKPGEVTGRQAENAIYGLRKEDKITDPNYAKFVSQIEKAKEKNKLDASSSISNYINMFSRFQDMNIPREYTGKLANGMSKYLNNIDINSSMNYYDTMRELPLIKQLKTKNQIETFISLLPDWKNNISDLVDVAKLI